VERLRERGVEVAVVGPGTYRGFGGSENIAASFRRRPWRAPLVLLSMGAAVRRAGRDADLIHAHWLASGLVVPLASRPVVLTLHGSGSAGRFEDLQLMSRRPRLARFLLRRARVVIAVSEQLAEAARRVGARDVRWIPNGVDIPAEVGAEADPPEILFVGRLAPEKGIRELAEAAQDLNLVVAGDGPLRPLFPDARGFVPHEEVERLLSRAAVVVLPSHREGLPTALLEAMAHGRAVVATPVGGIPSLVEDGRTGLLVPPGDARALREAIDRVLADRELRKRLGKAARERVEELCSWDRVVDETLVAYEAALS
jgi:glycosyltransferase involved in cell wall biosynthesis